MAAHDRALECFRVVCATGSIRAAARQLAIAPSAVSRQVATLERRLSTPLLERSARGIRPTEAGHLLVRFADDQAHLEELLDEELNRLRGLEQGRIRIAAGEGFVDDLVSHGLTPFMTDHPGISVELITGGTDEIRGLLLDGDVDLALALHSQPHPKIRTAFEAPQPLQLICHPGHPLASPPAVEPAALDAMPATVLPSRFGIRTLTDQLQRHHGIALDVRLVSSSIRAMLDFVQAGLGVTLLPSFAAGHQLTDGSVRAVPLTDTSEPEAVQNGVRAQLLVRRGRRLSHASARFIGHCGAVLTSLNGGVAKPATQR